MKLTYFFYFGIVFFTVFTVRSQDGTSPAASGWYSDYKKGVDEAKKSGKDLLVVFTGTKWIDICKKFDDEILSKPEFAKTLSKQFVLIKLEFPKVSVKPISNQAQQNNFLKDAYRVRGYPSVLLTDIKGRAFGINGYQGVKSQEYANLILAMFQEKQRKYDLLETAKNLSGAEKMKTLIAGIPVLPGNLSARFYSPEMKQAIAADPGNAALELVLYKKLLADVDYANGMAKLRQNVEWSKMLKLSDAYINQNLQEKNLVQRVLMNKIGVYKHLNNLEGVVQSLINIVKVDSESEIGKAAQLALDKLRAKKIEDELVPKK